MDKCYIIIMCITLRYVVRYLIFDRNWMRLIEHTTC